MIRKPAPLDILRTIVSDLDAMALRGARPSDLDAAARVLEALADDLARGIMPSTLIRGTDASA